MPKHLPRCRVTPLPGRQVAFTIDETERLRWHFGTDYPRPFFFPLNGPSGASLTRMGHPGAPNHDHHQSIWFAHQKVVGVDFWSNNSEASIRQQEWLVYEDGSEEAVTAVRLNWYDGHDPAPLLEQQLIVAASPGPLPGETILDLQSTFKPTAASLEFGRTNFGFLAVRVSRSISEHFGGGRLTDSEGRTGEKATFGNRARWMDYSGPAAVVGGEEVVEGVTYIDHPENAGHPAHWHVREDGWMGASACMKHAIETTRAAPLMLRYRLYAHAGRIDADRTGHVAAEFEKKPALQVVRSKRRHRQGETEFLRTFSRPGRHGGFDRRGRSPEGDCGS